MKAIISTPHTTGHMCGLETRDNKIVGADLNCEKRIKMGG